MPVEPLVDSTRIPAAEIDRVFNSLYRRSNVHGKAAGKGLGLAGACKIVEHHGGTINIESAEGVGTVVRVRLPLHSVTAALT